MNVFTVLSNIEEPLQKDTTLSGQSTIGFYLAMEHQTSLAKELPYSLSDYLELLDWTGRILHEDKRGVICVQRPRLLNTIGLEDESWLELAGGFGKNYQGAVGSLEKLALFASHTGKRWIAKKNILRQSLH